MKKLWIHFVNNVLCIALLTGFCFAAGAGSNLDAHAAEITYVLNTNTGKFHYPECSSVSSIKAKNRSDTTMSYEEVLAAGYVPCKNCNPGPVSAGAAGAGARASASVIGARAGSAQEPPAAGITYVLNTNTKKFHRPDCSSVASMKAKNRSDTNLSYAEVTAAGYEPCKKCNPR